MSKQRDRSDAVLKQKTVCVAKLARTNVTTERTTSNHTKITVMGKSKEPKPQQPLELISSSKRKQIELREPQQKQQQKGEMEMIAMTSNKENKPSSDTDWKRNLYVRGLSATTRVKELQKHLILTIGVKILDCTLIPGEPYYFKITMTSSEDASKCLKILNDTEIFGRKVKVERKERAPERDTGRSFSSSFGKELRGVSLLVDKSHSKTKGLKLTDKRRSRSHERHDRHLTSSRPHNKQKTTTMSMESKMRCIKSRERNHERSRSPIKNRHRRKPSIYWDVPPFGYECLTPIQYKAMLAQRNPTPMQGVLSIDYSASTGTVEIEDTSNIVPESLVYKLFIDGLLNNLNQEYVVNLLDCERKYLVEKIQFENDRERQRIERETLEREKIEMQKERERFERERWVEREKIKAERKELKRLQARSIALKEENGICASKTTTQETDEIKKFDGQCSVPIVQPVGLQLKSSSEFSEELCSLVDSQIEETSEDVMPKSHCGFVGAEFQVKFNDSHGQIGSNV